MIWCVFSIDECSWICTTLILTGSCFDFSIRSSVSKNTGGPNISLINMSFDPTPERFVLAPPSTNNKHSPDRLGAPLIRISEAFLNLWLKRFLVNIGCAFIVKTLRTAWCRLTVVNGFGTILLVCIMVPQPQKHGFCYNVAKKKHLKVDTSVPIRQRNPPTQAHQTTPAQIVTVTDRYIQHG